MVGLCVSTTRIILEVLIKLPHASVVSHVSVTLPHATGISPSVEVTVPLILQYPVKPFV